MKITAVVVAPGAGFTPVRAIIVAHAIRAIADEASASLQWEVQWPDDAFTHIFEYGAGIPIERTGQGHQGMLQPPPGYFAQSQPALGGIYFQVRDKAGAGGTLRMIESETELVEVQ